MENNQMQLQAITWRIQKEMMWLGYLMRLNPETPARKAFGEYLRKVKRPR